MLKFKPFIKLLQPNLFNQWSLIIFCTFFSYSCKVIQNIGSKNNFSEKNSNTIEKTESAQSIKFAPKDSVKSNFYFKKNELDSSKNINHSAQVLSKDSQNITNDIKESAPNLYPLEQSILNEKLTHKYQNVIGEPYIFKINSNLLGFVDEWIGIDYKYGGKDKNGIDCSGLVHVMLKSIFNINTSGSSLDVFHQCNKIKKFDIKEGDLVFFKTTSKSISHVGIYLANHKFVHCSTNYGVTISDLKVGYYASRFVGAGRFPIPELDLTKKK